jgi:hypothetical protein
MGGGGFCDSLFRPEDSEASKGDVVIRGGVEREHINKRRRSAAQGLLCSKIQRRVRGMWSREQPKP